MAAIASGALIVASPIWSGIFYYSSFSFVFSLSGFFAGSSALLISKSPLRCFAALPLLLCSFATYQAGASIYPVLVGLIAVFVSYKDSIRASLVHTSLGVAVFIAAYALYRSTISVLGLDTSYVTASPSLSEIPGRTVIAVLGSFEQFWANLPDYTLTVRGLEWIIVVISLLALSLTMPIKRLPITFFLVIGTIIASKALFIATSRSELVLFQYRYNLGVPFLYGGIFALGMSSLKILKPRIQKFTTWLLYTSTAALCLVYAQQDLIRQTVLYYGQMQDLAIMNRVLIRIENSDLLSDNRTYQFVRTGPLSNFRSEMLAKQNGPWTVMADEHMDFGSIGNSWVPESLFNVLGTDIQFNQSNTENWRQRTLHWRRIAVNQGRRPWPARESLWVSGNTLILHTYKTPRQP